MISLFLNKNAFELKNEIVFLILHKKNNLNKLQILILNIYHSNFLTVVYWEIKNCIVHFQLTIILPIRKAYHATSISNGNDLWGDDIIVID